MQYADSGTRETKLKIIDNNAVHFLRALFADFVCNFLQGTVTYLQAIRKQYVI